MDPPQPTISTAVVDDASAIAHLLNTAYRGIGGWTNESEFIAGDIRATKEMVLELIQKDNCIFLKVTNDVDEADDGIILGCVNLQKDGPKVYLGMFSVLPQMQGKGIGKLLLDAAEKHAKLEACASICMSVISGRTELIDWYFRRGYSDTGQRIPFHDDGITGKPLRPLEFMVLEKAI